MMRKSCSGWVTSLIALVLACTIPAGSARAADGDEEGKRDSSVVRTYEVGAGFGRYTDPDPDENANGQFFRLTWADPGEFVFRVGGGRQARFGETTYGIGASYGHGLPKRTFLTVGLGASTGELAPEWSGSISVRRAFHDIPFTLGYVHDEWESGASNDRFSLGAQKWFKHVILGAAARYTINDPGSNTAWGGSIGITYYQWKKLYIGGGYNFGDVRYEQLRPDGTLVGTLVEYDSKGYFLSFSRWWERRKGVNVRVGTSEPIRSYGIQVSWFSEW